METARPSEAGFTLVEIVVAMMILTVGLLGLAGTTALVVRQITLGELATQRAAAFQTAVEGLRTLEWADVGAGATSVGPYSVNWWIAEELTQSRVMKIVTVGPGISTAERFPQIRPTVADTFTYRLLRY